MDAVIDASDPAWRAPSPQRSGVLCVGTEIECSGLRSRIEFAQLSWLHGALSTALARGHDTRRRMQAPNFSLVPWPCSSGWAAAWWGEWDAAELAARRFALRIGRVETEIALGARISVAYPPEYAAGVHLVRVRASTPVVVKATSSRTGAVTWRDEPTAESITGTLGGLAARLGVESVALRVALLDGRTEAATRRYMGKPRFVRGWTGAVDLAVSAPARWLLECASRGLGLGGRTAYGCGAVRCSTAEQ